jgi:hypothetical protein
VCDPRARPLAHAAPSANSNAKHPYSTLVATRESKSATHFLHPPHFLVNQSTDTCLSKHSGLEKAVFQIEQALKRTHPGSDQIQNSEQSTELRYLLERSRDLLSAERSQKNSVSIAANRHRHDGAIPSPQQSSTSHGTPPSQTDSRDGGTGSQAVDDDQLNLDDAENPLQLLARTSELLSAIGASGNASGPGHLPSKSPPMREIVNGHDHDSNLATFFGRFRPRLDVGPDLDPVELGLLTIPEAEALFT